MVIIARYNCDVNVGKKLVAYCRNAQFPCTWIKFCNVETKKIYAVGNSCIQVLTVKFEVNVNKEW